MDKRKSEGKLTRREFLGLSAAAGAALGSFYFLGRPKKEDLGLLYASITHEEERKLGKEAWYPTNCLECEGGCSLLVRIIEGRAKVVSGNPLSPVNGIRTCARGQASVQGLYNPDRIKGPLKRTVSGLEPLSWEKAIREVTAKLQKLQKKNKTDHFLLLSSPLRGHLHWLFRRFSLSFSRQEPVFFHPFEELALRQAVLEVFGTDILPYWDMEHADCLVSFGAPFLESWLSPVQFSRAYGRFRRGSPDRPEGRKGGQGLHFHVEPRLSLTAASADFWLPARPGGEIEIARVLARELWQKNKSHLPQGWKEVIAGASIKNAAKKNQLPEEKIERLLASVKRAQRPLFLGGGSSGAGPDGVKTLAWVLSLNLLASNLNQPGGVILNKPSLLEGLTRFQPGEDGVRYRSERKSFGHLETIGEQILRGEKTIEVLFLYNVDPAHDLPAASRFRQAIKEIPTIVSFSPFPDDTTSSLAHYILPAHTPLEGWNDDVPDPAPGSRSYAIGQPVISPYLSTRHPGTVLLQMAQQLGKEMSMALPWKKVEDLIVQDLEEFYQKSPDRLKASFSQFLNGLIAKGGWFEDKDQDRVGIFSPKVLPYKKPSRLLARISVSEFAGDPESFPFYLLPYPSPLLGRNHANRPWLQQAGDPVTTIAWQSWVEINPKKAKELGLREGDIVRIVSPVGSVEAPVYLYAGIRPDTVAIPAGQGYQDFGRYAKKRGVNPLSLLAPKPDPVTGGLALGITRVRLEPTGRTLKLAKFEASGGNLGSPHNLLTRRSKNEI